MSAPIIKPQIVKQYSKEPSRQPSLRRAKPKPTAAAPATAGGLFNFDPNNLNTNDIESIAQNADKLISIISNIKNSVTNNNNPAEKNVNQDIS